SWAGVRIRKGSGGFARSSLQAAQGQRFRTSGSGISVRCPSFHLIFSRPFGPSTEMSAGMARVSVAIVCSPALRAQEIVAGRPVRIMGVALIGLAPIADTPIYPHKH